MNAVLQITGKEEESEEMDYKVCGVHCDSTARSTNTR